MNSTDVVLKEIENYLISFVEKSHPAFANLPVCPFAKKARLQNQLLYFIEPLVVSTVLERIRNWSPTNHQVLIVVDPRKDLDLVEYDRLTEEMIKQLPPEYEIFTAHPQSNYQERGIYTRREPYPNWQFMQIKDLEKAKKQLSRSNWHTGKQ